MIDALPPMMIGFLAFAAILLPAAGHLYHFILVVNIISGLGFRERTMDRTRSVLLFVFGISAILLLSSHLERSWWEWSLPFRAYAFLCVVSGGLIVPWESYRLASRRPPQEVKGRTKSCDLAGEDDGCIFIGPGPHAWELRLPGHDAFRLNLHDWDLAYASLPASLSGLRILQLTDLHLANCYRRELFDRIVTATLDWPADLVVVTGDLVEDDDCIGWIEPLFGRLEARLGKYVILGNHDADHHPDRILAALDGAGYESLEGRWVTLDVEGSTLAIGGTSAPWGPPLRSSDVPAASFRLLLSHSPDQFYTAARCEIDLVLAGHNHGGQIRFPLLGPLFMPSRYSRRFDRGYFRKDKTLMYVSEGIGGKHPVRYACPPEVSRFTLRQALTPDDSASIRPDLIAARGA